MKFVALLLFTPAFLFAQPPLFTLNHDRIETHNYAEITLRLPPFETKNPSADVLLTGMFISQTNDTTHVEGFCDAPDGSRHRIRFMPVKPGIYRFTIKSYTIRRRQIKNVLTTGRAQTGSYKGTFTAVDGSR